MSVTKGLHHFENLELTLTINPSLQDTGTFEHYNTPCIHHHVIPGLRVPSSSFLLIPYIKFPETGNQDAFPGFQSSFYYFQEGFNYI